MTALSWDQVGERLYETGLDHGVLYMPDSNGDYTDGVAWNGLTSISESPEGAEPNEQYADNILYLNLYSAERFKATLEAFTYPDEFCEYDGLGIPTPGVFVGQQRRKMFGLSYRTKIGNDVDGDDHGYKLHLVYGLTASPSEKAYSTISDSPEAVPFSWELSSVPTSVPDMKPTSIITIVSTEVDAETLASLELILYGDTGVDPALPLPATIISMFGGSVTTVTATQPSYNAATDTITIPTVTGVTYYIDGDPVTGAVVITEDTMVTAQANDTYVLTPGTDDDWLIEFT